MRVKADELTGATPGPTKGRRPRIASERSDIKMLISALDALCHEINTEIGPPGASKYHSPLRRAVWTAREVIYRATVNRAKRDRRAAAAKR